MIIQYKNETGTLEFNTKGEGDIRITDTDGLFLPQPTHYSVNYFGCDGQTTISSYVKNRTITISGDMKLSATKKFAAILTFSGELIVNDRKIAVCTPTVYLGKRYGNFVKYVLQMTCDNPYFTDRDNITPIYYRKDVITSPFTLPTVFTQGVSTITYNNESCYTAQPEIIFRCTNGGTYSGGISVENTSVVCKITLLCAMLTGETITVNTAKRTATSSKRGNMVKYLDENTYPGDFILRKGTNLLKASTANDAEEISCDMVSGIKYAECDIYG